MENNCSSYNWGSECNYDMRYDLFGTNILLSPCYMHLSSDALNLQLFNGKFNH